MLQERGTGMQALKEKEEMVTIEITFGNRKDDITVHFGDDPLVLAKEFTARHGLREKYIKAVAEHIESTVRDFKKNSEETRPQEPLDDGAALGRRAGFAPADTGERMMPPTDLAPEEPLLNDDLRQDATKISSTDGASVRSSSRSENAGPSNAEHVFNRLKDRWSTKSNTTSRATSKKKSLDNMIVNRETVVSRNKQAVIPHQTSNANERLYRSAEWDKKKRVHLMKQKNEEIDKTMAENKFKLNDKSKELAGNRSRGADKSSSIGEQLYNEGVRDKARKEKVALKGDSPSSRAQSWSCAQCGTFHTIPGLSVLEIKRICSNCGWSQEGRTPFKPVNIALELMPFEIPTKGSANIHDYLHDDGQTQKIRRVEHLRQHRKKEAVRITFKPSIPDVSKEIIRRRKNLTGVVGREDWAPSDTQTYGQSDRDTALGEYLKQPASDRLYATSSTWVPGKRPTEAMDQKSAVSGVTASDDQINKFVDRLVYEYKDKDQRIEAAQRDFNAYDYQSDQPFFQPRLNPLARLDLVTGSSELHGRKPNLTGLLERCDRGTERRKRDVAEHLEREKREIEVNTAAGRAGLQRSEAILDDAKTKSIEEMFRLLVATEHVKAKRGEGLTPDDILLRPQVLTKLAHGITDLDVCTLNLDTMEESIMVPEVGHILAAVKARHNLKKTNKDGDDVENKNHISFKVFRGLVLQILRQREGGGKSYVYVPKKQPKLAREMIAEEMKACTFKPAFTTSHESGYRRRDADLPIEDALMKKAERTKLRIEESRRIAEEQALEELSFQPVFHKPPKNIKARYREIGSRLQTKSDGQSRVITVESGGGGRQPAASMEEERSGKVGGGSPASPKLIGSPVRSGAPPETIQFQSFTPFAKHVIRAAGPDSAATERASPSSSYSTNIFYHPSLDPPTIENAEVEGTKSIADVNAISPPRAISIDFDKEAESHRKPGATVKVVHAIMTEDGDITSPTTEKSVTFSNNLADNVDSRAQKQTGNHNNDGNDDINDGGKDAEREAWYEEGLWQTGIEALSVEPDSDDEDSMVEA